MWGTVEVVTPFQVRPDGPDAGVVHATNIVGPVVVGDRVLIQMQGKQLVAYGPTPDTGWVRLILNPGFAAAAGEHPECRRIGSVVYVRGVFTNAGMTATGTFNVAQIPVGFVPPVNYPLRAGTMNAATSGVIFFFATGVVQIRTGSALSGYYTTAGATFPVS